MTDTFDGPGHYANMSNADYQATDAKSKSRLDVVERAPIHYWARYIDPDREPEETTEAKMLGDAIHTAVLEPDMIDQRFFVLDEGHPSRPTSRQINAKNPSAETVQLIRKWEHLDADAGERTILKFEQHKTVIRTRDAVWRDLECRRLLLLKGARSEQSFFAVDPETGAMMKARADRLILDEGMILDLKTTTDASPDGFAKSVENYRYYVQDPWYRHVVNTHYKGEAIEYFAFLAIEKDWPNACGIHYLSAEDQAEGYLDARDNLNTILECERTGIWPSYTDGPTEIVRPNWANRRRFRRAY